MWWCHHGWKYRGSSFIRASVFVQHICHSGGKIVLNWDTNMKSHVTMNMYSEGEKLAI